MKLTPRNLVTVLVPIVALQTVATAQMPVTKVVVREARMLNAQATVTLVGTVQPKRRSRVSAEIAGMIQEMPVREGDFVAEGDVLCKINERGQQLRLAAEAAKLASLKAQHAELLAGTRPEEIRRLKAMFGAATADYQRWQFEMARIEKLYSNSDSNTKEYRDTQAEFIAAQRRQIAAEADYNLAVEGPRKERIAQANHDVAEQQAIVFRAQRNVDKTLIRAPFAGHVVVRMMEVGEWVLVGGTVVEMIDLSTVLVRVDVPESALPYLTLSDSVRVKIDALGRSFEGRIKHIMRQADQSARTFPVDIEIDNSDGLLAGGMFARATVPAGRAIETVAVHRDAIVERDGTAYVALVMPGHDGGMTGILSPVTLGLGIDDWVALTSGNIQPGAIVITRGTERILPFPTPIEIVNKRGTPVAMPGAGSTGELRQGRKAAQKSSYPEGT